MYFIYFVFILIFILAFAVGGKLLWGYQLSSFSGFGSSFVSALLFICGFYNIEELLQYNLGFGIVYLIVISIISMFFIYAVLYSIFAESFRNTLVEYGYPEDLDKDNWSISDYIYWIAHFIPEKMENKQSK